MFNRNHTYNHAERRELPVRLVCDDGAEQLVSIVTGTHHSVAAVLNGADMFVEIETTDGVSRFVSKSSIRSAEPVIIARTDQLKRRLSPSGGTDPYSMLGINKSADLEEIQKAYRQKAAEYHPDRYASMDLPKEVHAYVDAMARRINMAWQEISKASEAA